jgi:hypothetical protein
MLKYEFVQGGEFSDPQYEVIFYNEVDEYPVGYLYFSDGNWNYADHNDYGLPAHLMIEIGKKMKEFDESVRKQLFLGRF